MRFSKNGRKPFTGFDLMRFERLSVGWILLIFMFCCTMAPSEEWIEADVLDGEVKSDDLRGRYSPTQETLIKYADKFDDARFDSVSSSYIEVKDDSILGYCLPRVLFDGGYEIASGKSKLIIAGDENLKFRMVDPPCGLYPKLKFRMVDGRKALLVDLGLDPDASDYYEYYREDM